MNDGKTEVPGVKAEIETAIEDGANAVKTKYDEAVADLDAFVVKHLHNSPVSQDTGVYNRVIASVEAIKRDIQALI